MPRFLPMAMTVLAGCFGTAGSASTPAVAEAVPDDAARDDVEADARRPAHERDVVRSIAGDWQLAHRDAEARIDRAVSDVTSHMNVFIRSIANDRIDEAVNPDQRVSIEADGATHVVIAIGGGRPVRLEIDGAWVDATTEDGRQKRVRAIVRGGRLSIHERVEDGTRVLTFQRRGDDLSVTTRIHSDRLPAPIVYGLDYRLTGREAVASR